MTQIFNDNVEVNMTIDGQPWLVVDAEVVLSRMDTPNYVDLLMIPDPDETAPTIPDRIDQLIGSSFRLEADNALISKRDSDAEEDNLLFDGQLANISATGKNSYEGIAYDPAQQAFAPESDGGSIMNQFIDLGQPEYTYDEMFGGAETGTEYQTQIIKGRDLAQQIVEELNIDEFEIELVEGGVTLGEGDSQDTFGYNRKIYLTDTFITVETALTKIREFCEAEWWFDKEGVFHIGVPRPTRHELKFITDADAGKTTPPYQGVRVIGSGAASAEGYSRTNMDIEDKIVVEASIAIDEESGDPIANIGEIKEPVFEYQNLEVSNDDQARGVAKKLVEDLAEQQSDGTVTVVGFPEVVPMDGIIMPNGEGGEYPDDDIRNGMPMGGIGYGVYKVRHRLNNSDGFITKIHCAGVTGVTATEISSKQANTTYDSTDVYQRITPADSPAFGGAEEVQ